MSILLILGRVSGDDVVPPSIPNPDEPEFLLTEAGGYLQTEAGVSLQLDAQSN